MATNRKILLVERPVEMFTDDCFEVVEEAVPEPGDGEAVVKLEYFSLDPDDARLGARRAAAICRPCSSATVMRSAGAGRVDRVEEPVVSRRVGCDGSARLAGLRASSAARRGAMANPLPDGIELLDSLSLFGSTGVTAYFGVIDIGAGEGGRDARRVGRGGRRRFDRGPDRQDHRLPGRRHRGHEGEVQLGRRRARLRRVHRLQGGRRGRRAAGAVSRTASTCTSTTSAATSSTPRSRT